MKERMPKRVHPRRASSPFLLSGMAYCGYCGKALVGKYAKSGEFAYYVCGTLDKKGSGSCPAKYLNTDKFESSVIIDLVRVVNNEMDTAMRSYQNELELISSTIAEVNHRLERLYDVIETGKLTLDDVVVRIRDLRQRQEQLQAKRVEIESQMSDRKVELADLEAISCYVDDLNDLLRDGTIAERRTFIRSFIQEIRVTGNEAVLIYTMPILPEKITIEKEGVLPTVQYGGRYRT
jgi:site-specific DNA recombinase